MYELIGNVHDEKKFNLQVSCSKIVVLVDYTKLYSTDTLTKEMYTYLILGHSNA